MIDISGGLTVSPGFSFAEMGITDTMARWPDNQKSNLIALAMMFIVFPLLAWLCVWFVRQN
jgi:predicted Na+-dependent transporter